MIALLSEEVVKYNPQDEEMVYGWIHDVTGEDKSGDFMEWLKSGVVLVKLVNKLARKSLKYDESASPDRQTENIASFLRSCREDLKVRESDLFTTADLYDGKSRANVIDGLIACSRAATKSGYKGPSVAPKKLAAKQRHGGMADAAISKLPKEYLLFFSYAQKDTLAETSIFFNQAQARYPKQKIFRDNETKFKLNELIQHVQSAKNVVILLSGNYAKRPFTLVELHHALTSGANICPVKVSRPGMEPFDFEQIQLDIKSGKIKDYLNKDGWDLLLQQGITPEDVIKDLLEVMNVTATSFSVEHSSKVQTAMIDSVFDGLTM